ncbi:hypothetical protein [Anaerosporobacter faecicola]|uniref:hypothetical protein n=1 Tax=Anaerosporobacter faecicola TaxID=2718714 RepID=UPI0014395ADD|nr:hypothetical protein [Anaerosporobacter faecicola]
MDPYSIFTIIDLYDCSTVETLNGSHITAGLAIYHILIPISGTELFLANNNLTCYNNVEFIEKNYILKGCVLMKKAVSVNLD